MQTLMRFLIKDIKTIQQPVQGFAVEHDCVTGKIFWPPKTILLMALVPEAKAVLFPVKDFDLIVLPIAKDKQRLSERVQLELELDHRR